MATLDERYHVLHVLIDAAGLTATKPRPVPDLEVEPSVWPGGLTEARAVEIERWLLADRRALEQRIQEAAPLMWHGAGECRETAKETRERWGGY